MCLVTRISLCSRLLREFVDWKVWFLWNKEARGIMLFHQSRPLCSFYFLNKNATLVGRHQLTRKMKQLPPSFNTGYYYRHLNVSELLVFNERVNILRLQMKQVALWFTLNRMSKYELHWDNALVLFPSTSSSPHFFLVIFFYCCCGLIRCFALKMTSREIALPAPFNSI